MTCMIGNYAVKPLFKLLDINSEITCSRKIVVYLFSEFKSVTQITEKLHSILESSE